MYLQFGYGARVVRILVPQCLNVLAQVLLTVLHLGQSLSLLRQRRLQSPFLLRHFMQSLLQLSPRLVEGTNLCHHVFILK